MKTALEHFNEFPEPYRSQAIENTGEEKLHKKYKTKSRALFSSFTWFHSPQKDYYWVDFFKTL